MVTFITPNWKEKKSILAQYGVKYPSNVKVAHNQEELLTVFKKHETSDITIRRRKLK